MSNIYVVGDQVFNVFSGGTGWRISVNGVLLDDVYVTRGAAWAAGLAEVDRIARNPPARGGFQPGPDGAAQPPR